MTVQNRIYPPLVRTEELKNAVDHFEAWLEKNGDTSQDQYDFWAFPIGKRAKAIYYRNKWLGLPFVAPFVLLDHIAPGTRALVRRPYRFPIADAHLAMAFWALFGADLNPKWEQRARAYLDALKASRCKNYKDYCWGYPFNWQTNYDELKTNTPLITTIPYCYEAFEAGYEATGDAEYLEIMESAARCVFHHFNNDVISPGVIASSYTPFDSRRVVNANAYRSFLLTSAGTRFGKPEWLEAANGNLAFVLQSQQADGSWLYAVDGKDEFIDNFHTCFVLKNLYKVWRINGDSTVLETLKRGYDFYKKHLLDPDCLPVPFAKSPRLVLHKRELYDFAEGIHLALLITDIDPEAPKIMQLLLRNLLDEWVLPDGHFITRQTFFGPNNVPYLRWAQSQTFLSMVKCYMQRIKSSALDLKVPA